MATYLVLYEKPYVPNKDLTRMTIHVDPGMTTEQVERIVEEADWDEQIVLKRVLSDLPSPVPFGFRKCDWSAWMVHPLPDHEANLGTVAEH